MTTGRKPGERPSVPVAGADDDERTVIEMDPSELPAGGAPSRPRTTPHAPAVAPLNATGETRISKERPTGIDPTESAPPPPIVDPRRFADTGDDVDEEDQKTIMAPPEGHHLENSRRTGSAPPSPLSADSDTRMLAVDGGEADDPDELLTPAEPLDATPELETLDVEPDAETGPELEPTSSGEMATLMRPEGFSRSGELATRIEKPASSDDMATLMRQSGREPSGYEIDVSEMDSLGTAPTVADTRHRPPPRRPALPSNPTGLTVQSTYARDGSSSKPPRPNIQIAHSDDDEEHTIFESDEVASARFQSDELPGVRVESDELAVAPPLPPGTYGAPPPPGRRMRPNVDLVSPLEPGDESVTYIRDPHASHHGSDSHASLISVFEIEEVEEIQPAAARASQLLDDAAFAAAEGNPERADELFREAVGLDPDHPRVLEALVRSHEEAGDFDALVDALRSLAARTANRKKKVEHLLKASEVAERELCDVTLAIDLCQDVLSFDKHSADALRRLSEMGEHGGHTDARAAYLKHQAATIRSPQKLAPILIKLGQLTANEIGDVVEAERLFQRAAKIAPREVQAWTGLEELARLRGDFDAVEGYLEKRARYAASPRIRSSVLVELAEFRERELGKTKEARSAYEQGLRLDPANEDAAAALLAHFIDAKRWEEAAKACDLLFKAARRDENPDRALEVLDSAMAIAIGMKNPARLVSVAATRFRLRPVSPESAQQLIDDIHVCARAPESLRSARQAIDDAAKLMMDLDPETLVKLGQVYAGLGSPRDSQAAYERALSLDPTFRPALDALRDIAIHSARWEEAAKLTERLAEAEIDETRRFDLLREAANIWEKRLTNPDEAIRNLEAARLIRPHDIELLELLVAQHLARGQADQAVSIQQDLVDVAETGEDRAERLVEMATLVERRLHDPVRAAGLHELALEANPKRLKSFEQVVRLLTHQRDFDALADAYRTMLDRIDRHKDKRLAFELHKQLGLILRDRLGRNDEAIKSFSKAAEFDPDDLEIRRIVTELLVVTDRLGPARDVALATITRNPLHPDAYHDIYELALHHGETDRAYVAADAHAAVGKPDAEQTQFLQSVPHPALADFPAAIPESAWASHIYPATLDLRISAVIALVGTAMLRMRGPMPPEVAMAPPLTDAMGPAAARVVQAFQNASDILSCPQADLRAHQGPGVAISCAPALNPTIIVSPDRLGALDDAALAFIAGRYVAAFRPDLRFASLFPRVQDLAPLLAVAVRATTAPGAIAPTSAEGQLLAQLTPVEQGNLREAVAQVSHGGSQVDLKTWLRSVDITCLRAGLLLSGSVRIARQALGHVPRSSDAPSGDESLAELLRYAISDSYGDLRMTLQIALG